MKALIAIATLTCSTPLSQAAIIASGGFERIDNNLTPQEEALINLSWTLDDLGGDQFELCIINSGVDGVVTNVYLEDTLGIFPTVSWSGGSVGVDYTPLNNPNFPEGNTIGFVETHGWKPTPPPVGNGIDIGENSCWELNWNGEIEPIRLGVHVQSIGQDDESSSWVATQDFRVVPEPSSTALIGIAGLGLHLRRRK